MKSAIRYGLRCAFALLLSMPYMACTTVAENWVAPEYQELAARSDWRLQGVAVESLDHRQQIEANATTIYRQLLRQRSAVARQRDVGQEEATPKQVIQLQVGIRETISERDFERYRTILIESELMDESGHIVGRGLYIVEAREGLESAHLLYRLLRASLEELR